MRFQNGLTDSENDSINVDTFDVDGVFNGADYLKRAENHSVKNISTEKK